LHYEEYEEEKTDLSLTQEEVMENLREKRGEGNLILGGVPLEQVEKWFSSFSIRKACEKRGYTPLLFHIRPDPFTSHLVVKDKEGERKWIEMVIRKIYRKRSRFFEGGEYLRVEWILAQDPYKNFESPLYPLPGQDHPGLGVGRSLFRLLLLLARYLEIRGIVATPHYFHNAVLYFRTRAFFFSDPESMARFLSLLKVLRKRSFWEMAWMVERKVVYPEGGRAPYRYYPKEMIYPFYPFPEKDYRRKVKELLPRFSYRIREEKWEKVKKTLLARGGSPLE
jgi:hypothetical protein